MAKKVEISFVPTRTVVPHGTDGPYPLYTGHTDWVAMKNTATNATEFVMGISAVVDDSDLGDEEPLGIVVVDHTELTGADVWYYWPTFTVIDTTRDAGHDKAASALALAYTAARNAWIASRLELLRHRFPNAEFDDSIDMTKELTIKSLLQHHNLK